MALNLKGDVMLQYHVGCMGQGWRCSGRKGVESVGCVSIVHATYKNTIIYTSAKNLVCSHVRIDDLHVTNVPTVNYTITITNYRIKANAFVTGNIAHKQYATRSYSD